MFLENEEYGMAKLALITHEHQLAPPTEPGIAELMQSALEKCQGEITTTVSHSEVSPMAPSTMVSLPPPPVESVLPPVMAAVPPTDSVITFPTASLPAPCIQSAFPPPVDSPPMPPIEYPVPSPRAPLPASTGETVLPAPMAKMPSPMVSLPPPPIKSTLPPVAHPLVPTEAGMTEAMPSPILYPSEGQMATTVSQWVTMAQPSVPLVDSAMVPTMVPLPVPAEESGIPPSMDAAIAPVTTSPGASAVEHAEAFPPSVVDQTPPEKIEINQEDFMKIVKELKEENKTIRKRSETITKENETIRKENVQLKSSIAEVIDRLDAMEQRNMQMQQNYYNISAEVKKLNSGQYTTHQEIDQIFKKQEKFSRKNGNLSSKISEVENRFRKVTTNKFILFEHIFYAKYFRRKLL